MKPMEAEFLLGAVAIEQFPKTNLPELAFSGRSNVGKSSLINSIVLQKNLALISSSPGKTRQINFFKVENKWSFADLPGFGYAQVSKDLREQWRKLNMDYLANRDNLKLIVALVDSRHDPSETDLGLIEWYENNGKDFIIILTKCDKIKPKEVEDRQEQIQHLTSSCKHCIEVLPYSVQTGLGRRELVAIIKRITE
ncbi:MAG: ribosome biogenesis GTP-binding protein YihA/YsxC [Candidatus Kapabacteria bacterium]|jgi:GTP-binding protein|nr:ribosome biogenesis GTP-binding protein YihA/YsxC [Candidatus Kapabacteria bacterium]